MSEPHSADGHHDDQSSWLPAPHPATIAAYIWARLAIRRARRGYATGLDGVRLTGPPRVVPDAARRGMYAALHHTDSRCLVRATVRRAWETSHGRDRALVIGVTAPSAGFRAHAWLDGDPPCCAGDYTELLRR